MRKALVTCLIVLALAGCNKNEKGAPPSAARAMDVASSAPAAERAATVEKSLAPQRMIVRRAQLSLIVADTSKAIETITAAAERNGGYVNDSKVWRDGELLRATLTFRVPSERLTSTLAEVRRVAKRVQSESMNSEEVTQEYVDLESQLRNLEATERELLQLMTTVRERTRRASDVLEMHQQISTVRSQIEQIKGRMRYLAQVSALSSVNVDVIPDAIAKPVVEPGWQALVVVKDAGRALVGALQGLATAAIWIAVYLLPVAFLFVLFGAAAWKIVFAIRARLLRSA